jgi:hypothetical protein
MPGSMITRRSFIGSCAACSAFAAPASSAEHYFDGCLLNAAGFKQFRATNDVFRLSDGLFARSRHFRTTGDSLLDKDMDRALGVVADLFVVMPAFGFYDPAKFAGTDAFEADGLNAFATNENTEIPGTRGTVGFGWDLLRREFYEFDKTGVTVMAVVAHEFAHVLQYDRGLMPILRVGAPRKSEIHADYLAGYFLGVRRRALPQLRFKSAGDLFIRLGRNQNGVPNRSHGDSKERLDAAEAGFRVAAVEQRELDYAVKAGLEYVHAG